MNVAQFVFILCLFLHGCMSYELNITEDELFLRFLFKGTFRLDFAKALAQTLKECLCTSETCAFSIIYLATNTYTVVNTTSPGMGLDLSPWPIFTCTAPTFAYVQTYELIDCQYIDPNSIDQHKTCYPYTTLRSESTVCPCINIWWIEENPSCPNTSEPEVVPCDTSSASTPGYDHDDTTLEPLETMTLQPTTGEDQSSMATVSSLSTAVPQHLPSSSPTVESSQVKDTPQTATTLSPTGSTYYLYTSFSSPASLSELYYTISLVSFSPTPTINDAGIITSLYPPSSGTPESTTAIIVDSDPAVEDKGSNSIAVIAAGVGCAVVVIVLLTVITLYIVRCRKKKHLDNATEKNRNLSKSVGYYKQPNQNTRSMDTERDKRYSSIVDSGYTMSGEDNYGYTKYVEAGSAYCVIGDDGISRLEREWDTSPVRAAVAPHHTENDHEKNADIIVKSDVKKQGFTKLNAKTSDEVSRISSENVTPYSVARGTFGNGEEFPECGKRHVEPYDLQNLANLDDGTERKAGLYSSLASGRDGKSIAVSNDATVIYSVASGNMEGNVDLGVQQDAGDVKLSPSKDDIAQSRTDPEVDVYSKLNAGKDAKVADDLQATYDVASGTFGRNMDEGYTAEIGRQRFGKSTHQYDEIDSRPNAYSRLKIGGSADVPADVLATYDVASGKFGGGVATREEVASDKLEGERGENPYDEYSQTKPIIADVEAVASLYSVIEPEQNDLDAEGPSQGEGHCENLDMDKYSLIEDNKAQGAEYFVLEEVADTTEKYGKTEEEDERTEREANVGPGMYKKSMGSTQSNKYFILEKINEEDAIDNSERKENNKGEEGENLYDEYSTTKPILAHARTVTSPYCVVDLGAEGQSQSEGHCDNLDVDKYSLIDDHKSQGAEYFVLEDVTDNTRENVKTEKKDRGNEMRANVDSGLYNKSLASSQNNEYHVLEKVDEVDPIENGGKKENNEDNNDGNTLGSLC